MSFRSSFCRHLEPRVSFTPGFLFRGGGNQFRGIFFPPLRNLLINLTPSKRLQARQPAICKAATEATSEVCLRGSADMNRSSLGELYPAAASCCCLSFAKQQASDNRSSACARKDFSDGGKRFTLLMIPGAESSSL